MLNGHARRIIRGNEAQVLCQATVDLISRFQRPFLWKITVTGQPPHAYTRVYELNAKTPDDAAFKAMEQFKKDVSLTTNVLAVI